MPTYEYQYTDTEHDERFEFVQSMRDSHLTHHPYNGRPCRRCVVAPHIQAGGSYIVDWQLGAVPGTEADANKQTPLCTEFDQRGAAVFRNARDRDRATKQYKDSIKNQGKS